MATLPTHAWDTPQTLRSDLAFEAECESPAIWNSGAGGWIHSCLKVCKPKFRPSFKLGSSSRRQ
eukprot:12407507-Karenia_brevis.AAC.1